MIILCISSCYIYPLAQSNCPIPSDAINYGCLIGRLLKHCYKSRDMQKWRSTHLVSPWRASFNILPVIGEKTCSRLWIEMWNLSLWGFDHVAWLYLHHKGSHNEFPCCVKQLGNSHGYLDQLIIHKGAPINPWVMYGFRYYFQALIQSSRSVMTKTIIYTA